MVTSNDPNEIIADCKTKADPMRELEIYLFYLCQQLEFQNERIEWFKEQLKRA
jgi:hypothetical protein